MYLKLTYFDTLYHRESTTIVCGPIEFKDGYIHFASGGHRYMIEVEYIRKIEPIED